jgi:(S)-mandelate dehydrogenase
MNVNKAINIADLRRFARARLPRVIFEYLDGAAEDEITVARNRAVFEQVAFVPRITAGHAKPDLSIDLFGERLELPFVVGPTGLNGIFWRGADMALARAAERSGSAFVLATASNESIEKVGAEVGGLKWFQLYPWGDQAVWKRLLDRAAAADFRALVVTVDSLVPGNRERDRRNQFAHDVTITPRTVLDGLMHPRWLFSVWLRGAPRFENLVEFVGENAGVHEVAAYTRKARHPDISWDDLATLRKMWKGPFLIKGVLAPEDATRAIAMGADGIIVSNHGGRQLDGATTTLEALPAIVDAAGDRLTVLMDGGLRRGSDVVKAMSLGAKAVVLGRAPLYGVSAAGEAGASRAIDILAEETARVMALLGCGAMGALSPQYLSLSRGVALASPMPHRPLERMQA